MRALRYPCCARSKFVYALIHEMHLITSVQTNKTVCAYKWYVPNNIKMWYYYSWMYMHGSKIHIDNHIIMSIKGMNNIWNCLMWKMWKGLGSRLTNWGSYDCSNCIYQSNITSHVLLNITSRGLTSLAPYLYLCTCVCLHISMVCQELFLDFLDGLQPDHE